MPIKTKRWNDPPEPTDGFRLLICRYRPRGIAKADETWDAWEPKLGPSKSLHGAVYTESASPVGWATYRQRYLAEMREQKQLIDALATRVKKGETIMTCESCGRILYYNPAQRVEDLGGRRINMSAGVGVDVE